MIHACMENLTFCRNERATFVKRFTFPRTCTYVLLGKIKSSTSSRLTSLSKNGIYNNNNYSRKSYRQFSISHATSVAYSVKSTFFSNAMEGRHFHVRKYLPPRNNHNKKKVPYERTHTHTLLNAEKRSRSRSVTPHP